MHATTRAPWRALLLAAATALSLAGAAAAAQAAGSWSGEGYLASPLREASGPSVAVAPTGAAVAGWQAEQGDFGQVDAYAATRASGSGPFATGGARFGVDTSRAHGEGDMGVATAVNAAGKAVVAWVQASFSGNWRVQAAVRAAGAPAFGPVQTLTAEGEDATAPAVAIDAAGRAVLVWRRHDAASGAWQVQGATLTAAGTTFAALGADISDEDDDQYAIREAVPRPHVAIAPSGAAVVAWDAQDSSLNLTARWARRGTSGGFGAPHDLGTVTHFADVAAGDDGTFALVWVSGSGGTGADALLARATTGDFGSATPVGSTPVAFSAARVGVDRSGTATVALVGADRSGGRQRAAVTSCPAAAACAGLTWLSADTRDAGEPALAVDAAGDAVFAWTRSNGSRTLIEASLHAHGAGWDAPVFVSGSTQDAHAPIVGIDGGGNVTAAWTAANVALSAVRQATGAVAGASAPPGGGGGGGGSGGGGSGGGGSGGGGASGGGGGGGSPSDAAVAASVKQSARVTLTRGGAFAGPKVACAEPRGGRCTVRVTFTTPGRRRRRGKAKPIAAGSARATIAPGKSKAATVKLPRAAKRLLAAKGRLKLAGTVVVTDAAGNRRAFHVSTTLKPTPRRRR